MIPELIGFSGMLIILFAFIMNQTHRWRDDFLIYDGFNALGSFLLIAYAIMISSYPFLILNLVWFIVSIRDVFLDLKKTQKGKAHVSHKRKRLPAITRSRSSQRTMRPAGASRPRLPAGPQNQPLQGARRRLSGRPSFRPPHR